MIEENSLSISKLLPRNHLTIPTTQQFMRIPTKGRQAWQHNHATPHHTTIREDLCKFVATTPHHTTPQFVKIPTKGQQAHHTTPNHATIREDLCKFVAITTTPHHTTPHP